MGFGMAVNLRSKLDKSTTMFVCDTDSTAIEKFKSEVGHHGPIEVVPNGFEAVKRAVGRSSMHSINCADIDFRALYFRCCRMAEQ